MRYWLSRHKLSLAVALAIMARLAALLAFPDVFAFTRAGAEIHGSVAYDEYAINLLDTGVYGREPGAPDAGLPPLYSYVLALAYGSLGRHYVVVAALHILFDALSIALLYAICRRLFARHGDWIGALAGLFFALYPYLIFQTLTLNDTALWILLLHSFVWLMIRLRERETFDRNTLLLALAAGAVLGISALARALLPPLAILIALWFLLKLSWRESLWRLLPVAVMSLLVLLPWLARGYQIYGGFVPIALNSGENVYQGNNLWTVAVYRAGYDVQWLPPPLDAPPVSQPLERSNFLARAGWSYLLEHPQRIPELLLVKFQVYWNVEVTPTNNLREGEKLAVNDSGEVVIVTGEGSHIGVTAANAAYQESGLFNVIGRSLHVLYFGGLWILALAGLWLSRRGWRVMCALVAVQASQTLMYLVFHPSTRYRSPTDPLLFVFSAYAVVWVVARFRGRQRYDSDPSI